MFQPDFRDMLSALSDEKADYLLVGAFALAVHARPRGTGDIDIWVRPELENARRVWTALAKFGAPVGDLQVEELARPGMVFQFGVEPLRIDILTAIEGVEFEDAWVERVEVDLDGLLIPVIGRRHLIENKRACGRPQDLVDAARLMEGNDV